MKPLKVGQRVKEGNEFGTISRVKEEYSHKYDEVRTIILIQWDFDGQYWYDLVSFKRNGGQIEEIEIKEFELYSHPMGIGVVQKGSIDLGDLKKFKLDEFELRRLIARAQEALKEAGC